MLAAGKCLADERSLLGQADGHRSEKEYLQAEALYKQIISESNDVDHVLQAQKRLTIMYIESNNEVQAKQAFQELVAIFAGHEGLSEAVFELAEEYMQEKKYDRAREVYQYIVDHWPQTGEAIDAQEAVVRTSIMLKDEAAAQRGYDDLITKFAGNEDLPKAVDHVADEYRDADNYRKARELYRYIVQRWPEAERAIESQRAAVLSSIRMGDDANAASEFEKLISDFAENEKTAWAVCEVADEYRESGRYDEALANYDYVVRTWPQAEHAIDSQTNTAKVYISLGDDPKAEAAIGKLLKDFDEHDDLIIGAIEDVAKAWAEARRYEKAAELYTYIVEHWPSGNWAVEAQTRLARMYVKIGDYEKADAAMRRRQN
ncbi:MAG: tetratricopeptide repeat protein [Planctomycetota bacterium]